MYRQASSRLIYLMALSALGALAELRPAAQQSPPPAPRPPATPRAAAPQDLTGYWVSVVTEDWRWRMVTPPKGDFISIPLSDEGRRVWANYLSAWTWWNTVRTIASLAASAAFIAAMLQP